MAPAASRPLPLYEADVDAGFLGVDNDEEDVDCDALPSTGASREVEASVEPCIQSHFQVRKASCLCWSSSMVAFCQHHTSSFRNSALWADLLIAAVDVLAVLVLDSNTSLYSPIMGCVSS